MKDIKSLLSKFKNLTTPDQIVREKTSLIIKNTTGAEIDSQNITYNKNTGFIFLKTNNHKQTIIFLKKEDIIKEINNILGKEVVLDIK